MNIQDLPDDLILDVVRQFGIVERGVQIVCDATLLERINALRRSLGVYANLKSGQIARDALALDDRLRAEMEARTAADVARHTRVVGSA